jgi:chromosome partitioning protein
VEIPKTAVTATTSAEFGTVYDISRYDGSAKTFKRARDAYDTFVSYIEGSIRSVWQQQAAAATTNSATTASAPPDAGKPRRR